MPAFDPFQVLRIITPGMILRGLIYPYSAAFHVVRAAQPELSGVALLREILVQAQTEPLSGYPDSVNFSNLGSIAQVRPGNNKEVFVEAESGTLQITALAADLIQIRARKGGAFQPTFSYAIDKTEWESADLIASETPDSAILSTEALTLILDKNTCRLSLRDRDGHVLLSESEGLSFQIDGEQIVWRMRLDENAAYYGLGEKACKLNLIGQRFALWNRDPSGYDRGDDPLYMSIPMVLVLDRGRAIGLFFDNPHRAWVDIGASSSGIFEYRVVGGEFRLYVMAGTPQTVLERYTELTGRTYLPPLWALGFHQSRWSYYPQERVLQIAEEFRRRQLPCDAIHLDIHYMDGYRCFTWDKKRFPDPRRMLERLHAQGFKAIAIIDPGIKIDEGYWVYGQGIQGDHFMKFPDGTRFTGPVWPGNCHFPDFSRPATREWWGTLYAGLLNDGVDAFWNDMNEIALITARVGTSVPDVVEHDLEGLGGTHAEIHNVYGLLMTRASSEGLRRLRPERRPLILTRSGWAGVQRYAMHWTADNKSTWDHLRLSIQMVLNLGLSGIPLTGPDVGGFTGGPSAELFIRWMQVGAFLPFYRVHSMIGSPDQEPWAFGPEAEAICRRYLELRYRLLPYIYTAVWQAAKTGWPVARAMSFAYPTDPHTYDLDDQYLFGDALLVAPVLEEGSTQRTVYLPAGSWYNFWTQELYESDKGLTIVIEAPLDTLPLFVKGGAIIPFWPVQQYVGEKPVDVLTLHAYRAVGKHTSLLYEDDGLHSDYSAADRHLLSRFALEAKPSGALLSITRQVVSGRYESPIRRIALRVIGLEEEPKDVSLEGGTLHRQSYEYKGRRFELDLDAPHAFRLLIQ